MSEKYLYDLAVVFRSKNAGPFKTTVDVFFKDRTIYEKVKSSGVINKQTIASLYRIPLDHVEGVFYQDDAMGIKVTILKPITADSAFATDVYGAQQHAPLMGLKIAV